MSKQEYSIEIPDYLTIESYMTIVNYQTDSKLKNIVNTVHSLTGIPIKELGKWSPKDLIAVSDKYSHLIDTQSKFYPLVEIKGQLYGFSSIRKANLGEYIDLEEFAKDTNKNLHKIAAILYRPVVKSRFKELDFVIREGVKMVRNKVDGNVFDWYEVEEYDSDKRLDREPDMKDFPVHIVLAGLSFFLSTGNLYINHTISSEVKTPEVMKKKMKLEKQILETLSQSIGGGGVLFTTSQNQTSPA